MTSPPPTAPVHDPALARGANLAALAERGSILGRRGMEGIMGDMMLAYAIDPVESGWRWRVFDVDGELVAMGVEASQAEAEAAVVAAFDTRRYAHAS